MRIVTIIRMTLGVLLVLIGLSGQREYKYRDIWGYVEATELLLIGLIAIFG